MRMEPLPDQTTDRIPRAQFLRMAVWFTLGLWLVAALLPLPFGRPGVWSALDPAGLFTTQTVLGALLGLVSGGALAASIARWRSLRLVAERLVGLVGWEMFRTRDYVAIAALAALGEEPLFRGLLQPLIGLTPTAILFGLLHATSTAHVIVAGVLGFFLGWLYRWSGSLWPPIAAHLMIDVVTGLYLARNLTPNRGD